MKILAAAATQIGNNDYTLSSIISATSYVHAFPIILTYFIGMGCMYYALSQATAMSAGGSFGKMFGITRANEFLSAAAGIGYAGMSKVASSTYNATGAQVIGNIGGRVPLAGFGLRALDRGISDIIKRPQNSDVTGAGKTGNELIAGMKKAFITDPRKADEKRQADLRKIAKSIDKDLGIKSEKGLFKRLTPEDKTEKLRSDLEKAHKEHTVHDFEKAQADSRAMNLGDEHAKQLDKLNELIKVQKDRTLKDVEKAERDTALSSIEENELVALKGIKAELRKVQGNLLTSERDVEKLRVEREGLRGNDLKNKTYELTEAMEKMNEEKDLITKYEHNIEDINGMQQKRKSAIGKIEQFHPAAKEEESAPAPKAPAKAAPAAAADSHDDHH